VSTSDETDVAQRMEQAIRRYYAACNTGDVEAVAAFFTPDAVHYVPPGYGGSPRGGRAIGEVIARLVQATASRWSIDQVVCDPAAIVPSSSGQSAGQGPWRGVPNGTSSIRVRA
jgi:ketosteroid isomerase-like protein